ncbi:MAG TPA: hypothetical protein VF407_11640 [Polyangiaceae bacterium]
MTPELTSNHLPLLALAIGSAAGCLGVIFARRGIELALVTFLALALSVAHLVTGEILIGQARAAVLKDPKLTPAEQANESEWLDAQAGGRLVVDGGCSAVLVVIGIGALARGIVKRRDAAVDR